MTEYVTEAAHLEHRITKALETIREEWPQMLPRTVPPVKLGGGGRAVGIVQSRDERDDEERRTYDIDRLTVIASLRREVTDELVQWCRTVIDDRPLTATRVDGTDVPGMCVFLERHARWMSGHADAPEMADRLGGCEPDCEARGMVEDHSCRGFASMVKSITKPPPPRETMAIGTCPNHIGHEGDRVVCGATVRIHPKHVGDIRCPGCGKRDTYDGWVIAMVGTQGPYTAAQLIPQLKKRLDLVTTESTIRTWVEREVLFPIKDEEGHPVTDDGGRVLFDIHDVAIRLTHKMRNAG